MEIFILATASSEGDITTYAFSTEAGARAVLISFLTDDWDADTPEDEDGNTLPFPDDITQHQPLISEWRGGSWTPWSIETVTLDGAYP